jgi:hypothetical protein
VHIDIARLYSNRSAEAVDVFRQTEETAIKVHGPMDSVTLKAQVHLLHALVHLRLFLEAEGRANAR